MSKLSAKEIKALVDISTTTGYTGDVHVTLAYQTSYPWCNVAHSTIMSSRRLEAKDMASRTPTLLLTELNTVRSHYT